MAYRSVLGGSPLGLIGVRSQVLSGQPSSFNAGKTRNISDVNKYNNEVGLRHPGTLFTGKRTIRAWPEIKAIPESKDADGNAVPASWDTTGTKDVQYFKPGTSEGGDTSSRKTLHNDSVYDTSILNIIEQLANTKAELKPADFAYLKNVGVYPNNRLMIARRFASPIGDNIMMKKFKDKNGAVSDLSALAVLISWLPENSDFLDIQFGEEWEDAEADFKGVLNSLGEDIGLGNLGGIAGAAGNALPLPGFTEIFQRHFLAKLGLIEDASKNQIPAGNPNLIKSAKKRKTIGYTQAGAGLMCQVNIKMLCEYELKFISGIDPTIVWMDLLGMITRFGTSSSETYGLSKGVAAKMIGWANNPNRLISDVASSLKNAITGIVSEVRSAIDKAYNAAMEIASTLSSTSDPKKEESKTQQQEHIDKTKAEKDEQSKIITEIEKLFNKIGEGLVLKYRVRILGIVNALSGLPSTPWHITIGNPLRPVFCSGDMFTTSVNLKLGPTLAFNDLPSSITVEFNLQNARPWGLQEIMGKFNSGYLRTVDIQKTYYETAAYEKGKDTFVETTGKMPFDIQQEKLSSSGSSGTSGTSGTSATSTGNATAPTNGTSAAISTGTSGTSGTSAVNSETAPVEGQTRAEGGQNQNKGITNGDANGKDAVIDTSSNASGTAGTSGTSGT
jgi:hypothetical protein